jgi:isopenicillin-N epimerase
MSFGHHMLEHWALEPGITYLNHGTVGVPPRRVLAAQQAIRDEIERQPSRFLLRELGNWVGSPRSGRSRLRSAAEAVAAFVGAQAPDLVFVDNATSGANAVLRSISLGPGDELVLTDHTYGAVRNAADFAARQAGARLITVEVPYPAFDPGQLVERIASALGPRTRLLLIDHIASESALVFPVAEIAARARARGIPVLVDGAHVPGALPLDIPSLGVDYYTANLHKWAHAPRSSAFLWAAPERQTGLHPVVISWGLDQGFAAEFDWVGTRDPSPWLAAPVGIAFLHELGFEAVRAHNHRLAWDAARALVERWGTSLSVDEACVGSMVTLPLPGRAGSTREDAVRLRDALLFEEGIEVQMHARQGRLFTRISAQVYNERDDFERLGEAVARRIPSLS